MSEKYLGSIVAATAILGSLGGVLLNAPEAKANHCSRWDFTCPSEHRGTCNFSGADCSGDSQIPIIPTRYSPACVFVDSRSGWQRFNLPGSFTKVISITGGWTVDTKSFSLVSSSGHTGRAAEALAPFNRYKFDQKFPFGALLMGSRQGVIWVQKPGSFSGSSGAVDMRINDADNALGDNGGSLKVCFGN